jgi:hypothetical protein
VSASIILVPTLEEADAISKAFDAGNYGNAYESTDLESFDVEDMPEIERAAFVLGFFGSYSLDEIGSDREIFDAAYWSPAGQYVITIAKYCDDRKDDYQAEEAEQEAS